MCVHSSLRSFGHVAGGAAMVVQSFLDEGCTLLVPTFSSSFEIAPPPHLRFARNGWRYDNDAAARPHTDRIFTTESQELDDYMGAIPAAVVARSDRVRGLHPLDSFTAVGRRAVEIVAGQAPTDVYAPLVALAQAGGSVLLMGVGLERMTLLHLAENVAGRVLFRRWANDRDGGLMWLKSAAAPKGSANLSRRYAPSNAAPWLVKAHGDCCPRRKH